jgi:hypothetical protein
VAIKIVDDEDGKNKKKGLFSRDNRDEDEI